MDSDDDFDFHEDVDDYYSVDESDASSRHHR